MVLNGIWLRGSVIYFYCGRLKKHQFFNLFNN